VQKFIGGEWKKDPNPEPDEKPIKDHVENLSSADY
jgi:hypothetical protein